MRFIPGLLYRLRERFGRRLSERHLGEHRRGIGERIRKRVRYSLELGFGDRFRIGYRG